MVRSHQTLAFGYQHNLFVNLTTTQSSTDTVTKNSTFLSTESISFRNYSTLSSRRILSCRVKTPATLALFDEELNMLTLMIKSEVHCRTTYGRDYFPNRNTQHLHQTVTINAHSVWQTGVEQDANCVKLLQVDIKKQSSAAAGSPTI